MTRCGEGPEIYSLITLPTFLNNCHRPQELEVWAEAWAPGPPKFPLLNPRTAGPQTPQEPPKPMLTCPASTSTGTFRAPLVSCSISSRAWGSSRTSR